MKNMENKISISFYTNTYQYIRLRNKTRIKEIRKSYERERLPVKQIIILYHCYFINGLLLFSGILIRNVKNIRNPNSI